MVVGLKTVLTTENAQKPIMVSLDISQFNIKHIKTHCGIDCHHRY